MEVSQIRHIIAVYFTGKPIPYQRSISSPLWWLDSVLQNDKFSEELESAYQRFLGNKESEIIEQAQNIDKSVA